MVALSWESFRKPENLMEDQEEQIEQEIPGGIQDEIKPESQKPEWGNFRTPETYQGESDPTEDESWFEYIGRNGLANASRLVEQIAGKYGNIEKFAKDTLTNSPMAGGPVTWALSELMGPEKWERLVRGQKDRQQILPTSENLKELSGKLSGGYTQPKTPGEKKFQEYTETIGSVATGTTPANLQRGQAAQMTFNKLLIPSAATATKQIVEGLGFGEDKANLAKLAVWVPLTLAGNINAPAYASNLMNQGRNIPANVNINVPRMTQALDRVERTLLSSDPRTQLARQQVNAIRQDLANGQTSVRSAMQAYDGINAAKRSRGMFELGRGDRNFARNSINRVQQVVRDEILDSGSLFPNEINSWQSGVQAWSVIHRSNAIKNWVEDLVKGPYGKALSGPALGLFGVGAYAAKSAPLVSGTLAAGSAAGYKAGITAFRILQDQNLARYYWGSVNAAMSENIPAFIQNEKKLNEELKKSNAVEKKTKSKKNQNKEKSKT